MSNIKNIDICEVKKDVADKLLEAVDIVDTAGTVTGKQIGRAHV